MMKHGQTAIKLKGWYLADLRFPPDFSLKIRLRLGDVVVQETRPTWPLPLRLGQAWSSGYPCICPS